MAVVYVKRVETYDERAVRAAVAEQLDALGVAAELRPGLRVTVKPNLLSGRKPESGVTTHPAVLAAVIAYLRERGVEAVTVADSPSGPYVPAALKTAYAASGYRRPDIEPYLNYDVAFRRAATPPGSFVPAFNIIAPLLDADYIIDLGKLKTHAMTTMTGTVKNLFGAVPGLQKPDLHFQYPELADFSKMLCELAALIKPAVAIADAVDAMEGNGPGGGTVRHAGLLFASRDPFSLDAAAARFIGLAPEDVPYLAAARRMGLLTGEPELRGDAFAPADPPFRLPDTIKSVDFTGFLPQFLRKPAKKFASRALRAYPQVRKNACVGCGKCAESCPQHIIRLEGGKARMTRQGCISCFCCQEVCPARAIDAKRTVAL